jgi:hypothetical protein
VDEAEWLTVQDRYVVNCANIRALLVLLPLLHYLVQLPLLRMLLPYVPHYDSSYNSLAFHSGMCPNFYYCSNEIHEATE